MEYNISGINLQKIINNIHYLDKLNNKNKKVFLVLGGSFNPVHVSHITLFDIAHEYLKKYNIEVVGGFLGITSDFHVINKLGRDAMLLQNRIDICEIACKYSKLVVPIGWREGDSIITTQKIEKLILNHFGYNIEGINICGSDLFNRGGFFKNNVVCVKRKGCNISDNIIKRRNSNLLTYIIEQTDDDIGYDLSSTKCRELIVNKLWKELRESGWIYDDVIDYLSKN